MNKAAITFYSVLFPGKVEALTFSFRLNAQIYSWISNACHCLPHLVNGHRTLAYKAAHQHICKSTTVRSLSLTFWLSSSFLSAGLSDCDAAFLLCKGTWDRTHSQPSRNTSSMWEGWFRLQWELLFTEFIPGNATKVECVQFRWIGVEVRNPDFCDMTQGEGQYDEAVFNWGTQSAEHKEMCWSGGRMLGMKLGEKGMASL